MPNLHAALGHEIPGDGEASDNVHAQIHDYRINVNDLLYEINGGFAASPHIAVMPVIVAMGANRDRVFGLTDISSPWGCIELRLTNGTRGSNGHPTMLSGLHLRSMMALVLEGLRSRDLSLISQSQLDFTSVSVFVPNDIAGFDQHREEAIGVQMYRWGMSPCLHIMTDRR